MQLPAISGGADESTTSSAAATTSQGRSRSPRGYRVRFSSSGDDRPKGGGRAAADEDDDPRTSEQLANDEQLRRMAELSSSDLGALRPLPEDVVPASEGGPRSARRKRVEPVSSAPSLHFADSVFRQDGAGNFSRVSDAQRFGGGGGGGGGDAGSLGAGRPRDRSPERAGGAGVGGAGGGGSCSGGAGATHQAGNVDVGAGRGGGGGGGGFDSAGGGGVGGVDLPPSPQLQVASAIYSLFVAPTRFAPGLLAGIGAFEAAVLAQLSPHLRGAVGSALASQPLPTLLFYSTIALHIFRVLLWGSVVSFGGVALQIMVRAQSRHYELQPWRKSLDLLLLLLYGSLIWVVFADRQLAWTLTSSATSERLPFFAPKASAELPFFISVLDLLTDRSAALAARDFLFVLGGILALVPASDEYFLRKPGLDGPGGYYHGGGVGYGYNGGGVGAAMGAAGGSPSMRASRGASVTPGDGPGGDGPGGVGPGGARAYGGYPHGGYPHGGGFWSDAPDPHVLRDGVKHIEGGVSLLVGMWSAHTHMAEARPADRAADGGPAFLPLPWRSMRRSVYGGRVCGAMALLCADLLVNVVTDSVHWQQMFGALTSRGDVLNQDVIAAIVLLIVAIVVRIGFMSAMLLTVVATAHFRFGRYSELMHDFGGAMVVSMAAFVAMVTLRIVRIVRAARSDAVFDNTNAFWEAAPLGPFYSTLWCLHLVLTPLQYIKGVSALRRLASSKYHTHPDELRRIERRVSNPYYASSIQMAPL